MQQEHSDFLSTSCWSCVVPYNITPGNSLSTATDLWSESSFQMDAMQRCVVNQTDNSLNQLLTISFMFFRHEFATSRRTALYSPHEGRCLSFLSPATVSLWCGSLRFLLAAPKRFLLTIIISCYKVSLMIFTSCYNISLTWILTISINYSYTVTRILLINNSIIADICKIPELSAS